MKRATSPKGWRIPTIKRSFGLGTENVLQDDVRLMAQVPTILYEDRHIIAVNKPAGWATMGLPQGRQTLLTWLKQWMQKREAKLGNVYLGVVSRLDTPVTGVVLLAKTSKAAARLTEQFRQRTVIKTYWAVVERQWHNQEGTLRHWIRQDSRFHRVHITHAKDPDGEEAVLSYRVLATRDDMTLLEVRPQTGRKHQIRVQLSACGHPIVGDQKYGAKTGFPVGIALHARRLEFAHPVGSEPVVVEAPLPEYWRHLGFGALMER